MPSVLVLGSYLSSKFRKSLDGTTQCRPSWSFVLTCRASFGKDGTGRRNVVRPRPAPLRTLSGSGPGSTSGSGSGSGSGGGSDGTVAPVATTTTPGGSTGIAARNGWSVVAVVLLGMLVGLLGSR